LEEATGEAYAVLHLIYGEFDKLGEWPLWQYVEGKLDPAGTGKTGRAVESMPRVSGGQPGWGYGWLWWDDFIRSNVPYEHQRVQITVAGMWATRLDSLPKLYVGLLRLCNERYAGRELLPTQFVTATVTSDDMRTELFAEGTSDDTASGHLDRLRQVAEQERPTFGRIANRDLNKGYWEVAVPENITRYAGIRTVEGYLSRRIEEIESTLPAPVPTAPPPISLRPPRQGLGKRLVSRSLVENIVAGVVAGVVVAGILAGLGFLTHLW
jgi:hypothetical protein